uniref:Putative secreted peptide n=1 Tax=Anopheles braziliensis TaxID=58242 RepID=A0A2M3ZEG3_9DIPT
MFCWWIVVFLGLICCVRPEEEWRGLWFPNVPEQLATEAGGVQKGAESDHAATGGGSMRVAMGIENPDCDDAKHGLAIDFDPYNITHSTVYMCLEPKADYKGDYNMDAVITEHIVPSAYVADHKCMNNSIEYAERIPSYGTHRPLWPRYGEYRYVPTQRWLHNSEHGAVIALYHPCANKQQVDEMKQIVKGCLFRHIITPSQLPTRDRPFVLVTWHATLEFSVLVRSTVESFIEKYALKGPEQTHRDGQYDHLLLDPAKVVSTEDDSVLCPKKRRD